MNEKQESPEWTAARANQNSLRNIYRGTITDSPSAKPPTSRGVFPAAGRWSGIESKLRNIAWRNGCEVRIDVDRGFISHSVRFEFYGNGALEAINEASKLGDLG